MTGGRPPHCGVCGHVIDVTVEHVTIVRQVEVIAGETIVVVEADELVSYHEGCERRGWQHAPPPRPTPVTGTQPLPPHEAGAAS